MMTNEEIEKIAKRVSELVLDGILQSDLVPFQDNDAEEAILLSQLAQTLTELDYNLANENYLICEALKDTIKNIETKLNKFK
jgi:hypothetical protein|tara:strand:- start:92 stop:337 length:246 start_codon:yes stop_codon:yes gene_type:complete